MYLTHSDIRDGMRIRADFNGKTKETRIRLWGSGVMLDTGGAWYGIGHMDFPSQLDDALLLYRARLPLSPNGVPLTKEEL